MKRDFDTVVKTIENAEKDVDKLLKAARLQRHEKQTPRVDWEILLAMFVILMVFGMFALMVIYG